MVLIVPRAFLKDFFEYVFHSILPDCTLWGKKSSVILEPICFLKIDGLNIVDWKLIDELMERSFVATEIRTRLEEAISHANGSDLEQVLGPPIARDIFELDDNPFLYPGQRLAEFISEFLPRNPGVSRFVDGICHFHPTGDASLSGANFCAMRRFVSVMGSYEKKYVVALTIAKGNPSKYIEKSRTSKSEFVGYMMRNLRHTSLNARIFYPGKEDKDIDVSIT